MTCRHFGSCGGCAHQDLPDSEYRALKRRTVIEALHRHGIDADVAEVVEVAPGTRRRAAFKAKKTAEGVVIGFHAARSHAIVDMHECLVLTPALAALVPHLREMLAGLLCEGEDAELHVTDTDTGVDLALRWRRPNNAATLAAVARWAARLKLARVSAHNEVVVELAKPVVRFGKAAVVLPPESFLQPTRDGEGALQQFVADHLKGAKRVADLFAGCGTFAFVLAEKARVHAVEIDAHMLGALASAARGTAGLRPLSVEKRNLFRLPLREAELTAYDAVCLDPPRAGALDQAKMLAASRISRVAYVSCDADSFSRDASVMIGGGLRLKRLVPVDQFLWSSHIELVAAFERA